MLEFQRDALLHDGKTLRGRDIVLNGTHEQNYGRSHVSQLQCRFVLGFSRNADEEGYFSYPPLHAITRARADEALKVAHILVTNLNNPAHYGDHRPGLFSSDREPIFLNPRNTYWDLVQYGVTGDDGFEGFLRDANLPSDTAYETILIAAGLLLIDWIVEELDNNRESFASFLCGHAHELAEELLIFELSKFTPEQIEKAVKKKMSEAGRQAAIASHAETYAMRDEVVAWYDANKGQNSKLRTIDGAAEAVIAARLNTAKFRTVQGWISTHRKKLQSAGEL
jgi:hypothetical protein